MTFARGTRFELAPSATLTGILWGVVALATAAPLLTSMPWPGRWLLAGGVAICGAVRLARFRQPLVRSVAWSWDNIWTVTDRRGLTHVAELAGFRMVGRSVVLHLRWRYGAGHVALLPDNADTDHLRILRARLGRGS